ncbi:MAG: undecaprenyldiphospho-muramoylpentapeptide beta-N-acetylglucosaminyltransferase [Patescibacteria group bacterium]
MRIVFTGGGTAGHILPNIAVFEELQKNTTVEALYIGSFDGPERAICGEYGVRFQGVSCGKFRRYFSWKNFLSPFQVVVGFFQSLAILRRFRAKVVMSKGGYVSFPVVLAAWVLRIPVILHESDVSPGMANRMCARLAKIVCVAWPETKFPGSRTVVTGIPVRDAILRGSRAEGLKLTGFSGKKPILLVMGGSLGAQFLNQLVVKMLPELVKVYDVVHLTGRGGSPIAPQKNYISFEYLNRELAHVYALTDVCLSRAGASAISEFSSLKIPAVYVPLGTDGSRGDQILNARKMEDCGGAVVIVQKNASVERVTSVLAELASDGIRRAQMADAAYEFGARCVRAASVVADLIFEKV